jgi:fucose 4-O-acetylase-like acetyltransferase
VRRCIVVMHSPCTRFPFLWLLVTQQVLVTSELKRSNFDAVFDLWGCILSEQSLPCQKNCAFDFQIYLTCFIQSWRLGHLQLRRWTFRFQSIFVNPCLVICDHAWCEVLVSFCPMKETSGNRQVVFLLLSGEHARNEFHRNVSHVQILCENGLSSIIPYTSLCRNVLHC